MPPKYCSQCGQALAWRRLPGDSRERLVCSACGRIAYRNAKPCAGVLPTQGGKLLLARRAVAPFQGCWDIIGGFMEHDETPEEAALREAEEETGLTLALLHLLGVYLDGFSWLKGPPQGMKTRPTRAITPYLQDGYGGDGDSTLNFYYVARILDGEPRPADDVAELGWFSPQNLPAEMAFPRHAQRVLADWVRWMEVQAEESPSG